MVLAKSTPNTTSLYLSTWNVSVFQVFKFPTLPFRSVSSSCLGSLDIRSPGVFTETFLDHYHLDICKSNAKTHKIISINRFGITCCYFSSGNIPAIALFAATFLSNLVLSQSNQCFGCGLDQSHCRKLHIQIWLWPGLATASTDNTLLDLHNSLYDTKAEFNNCFIIHSK